MSSNCIDFPDISDEPINPWKELLLWFLGLSKHTLPALWLSFTEKLDFTSTEVKRQYAAKAEALEAKLNEMLGNFNIILSCIVSNSEFCCTYLMSLYVTFCILVNSQVKMEFFFFLPTLIMPTITIRQCTNSSISFTRESSMYWVFP